MRVDQEKVYDWFSIAWVAIICGVVIWQVFFAR